MVWGFRVVSDTFVFCSSRPSTQRSVLSILGRLLGDGEQELDVLVGELLVHSRERLELVVNLLHILGKGRNNTQRRERERIRIQMRATENRSGGSGSHGAARRGREKLLLLRVPLRSSTAYLLLSHPLCSRICRVVISAHLGVQVDLEQSGSIRSESRASSNNLRGVDNVLQHRRVDGSQSAGARSQLSGVRARESGGEDRALRHDGDMLSREFLLELADQARLQLQELLVLTERHEHNDGSLVARRLDLLSR